MKIKLNLQILLITLFLPLTTYSQGIGIFVYLDEHSIDLTDRQQEVLDTIQSWPQTNQVWLIRIDETRFDLAKQILQLNLPERIVEGIKRETISVTESRSSWSGGMADTRGTTILLSADDDDMTGHIQIDGKSYSILPLTEGIQALIELDPTKFDNEAPPIVPDNSLEKDNQMYEQDHFQVPEGSQLLSSDPVIDVIVAYTPEAKVNAGNIRALINTAGNLANLSFGNSDISANIHIVAMVEVDYEESGDANTDLNRLRLTSDGYMDEIHQLRDDFNADLVALITGSMNFCGIAYMPSSHITAFSVTRYDCIDNHTFSHEIGHNLGANHDVDNIPNNDPEGSPFEYGHGYRFTHSSSTYRTIMAYTPGTRVNHWSNPDINYEGNGPTMGSALYEDNARVWDERAPIVASFRPSPIPGTLVFENGYTVPPGIEITIAADQVVFQDNLVVPNGAQLTIYHGNSISFDTGASLEIEYGGELKTNGEVVMDMNKNSIIVNGTATIGSGFSMKRGGLVVNEDATLNMYGADIEVHKGGMDGMIGYAPGWVSLRGEVFISGAHFHLEDGSGTWGGVNITGPDATGSSLANVLVEHADFGISLNNGHVIAARN